MMTNSISLASATTSRTKCNSSVQIPTFRISALPRLTSFASKMARAFQGLLNDPIEWVADTKIIRTLTDMYSGLLEERISRVLTLHLVNVQLALFATVMPAELPVATRLACLAWFAFSLCGAKREYQRHEAE